MPYTFKTAKRIQSPIIIGLAGPSKSGKTFSALRLAVGMAAGGQIAMINTEGMRGHQYAEKFNYVSCDITEPFAMKRYEEAMKEAASINPSVLIIDSVSHAHEGIGGMLDQHESELDRMAGKDYAKRERMTWAAWVKPKKDEADMINFMLQVNFHIILCFRAKEKVKIVKGQSPVDLGWRPIGSDRIHFETAFTLILPPNSKGTPDLSQTGSELRSPFDSMITGKQIDERLGQQLAEWAKGGITKTTTAPVAEHPVEPNVASHEGENTLPSDVVLAKIGKVDSKKFKGEGDKTIVGYFIHTATGSEYGTLDATIADLANTYQKSGELIKLKWKPGKKEGSREVVEIAA
jgi:hypothetical protein